jgi:lysine 2,3-aminomutase
VALTDHALDLIDPLDPFDPVAAQLVPRREELVTLPEELADPIGDVPHSPILGIVHRYPDRVLLKPLHVCPVYCRFCFRREVVGPSGGALSPDELRAALDWIRARPIVWEVILTGGDPLVLSARRIGALVKALAAIDHVQVIRIHTRVPVMDPARITDDLVDALRSPKATYVVLHANHPRELTAEATAACARIVDAGIPMLSQSVLLRGVNADAETLEALFRALVARRIKPYYLHHPDLAEGTSHFRVSLEEGQELMATLQGRVSGLCRPTYVLDIPGGHGKVPAGRAWIEGPDAEGRYQVTDPAGTTHRYPSSD